MSERTQDRAARAELLADAAVQERLARLPDWALLDGKLHRTLRFRDFRAAFAFMAEVALAAEKHDHHPEWSNVYATVTLDWTTHSAGGLTQLDFDLAACTDAAARGRVLSPDA